MFKKHDKSNTTLKYGVCPVFCKGTKHHPTLWRKMGEWESMRTTSTLHDWATEKICILTLKVKVKKQSCPCALIRHHAMRTYWGSICIASRILNLGTTRRWVVSFILRPPYTRVRAPPPGNHWIAGWVGPRAGLDAVVKRKKFHYCPCWELEPSRPARIPESSVINYRTVIVNKLKSRSGGQEIAHLLRNATAHYGNVRYSTLFWASWIQTTSNLMSLRYIILPPIPPSTKVTPSYFQFLQLELCMNISSPHAC
jgi:hypothetical protein